MCRRRWVTGLLLSLFLLSLSLSYSGMGVVPARAAALAVEQRGTTEIVSIHSDGTRGNGPSLFPSISADGRYVAFLSDATNLVDDDTNGVTDCFVHDRLTDETTRISVASDGSQGNGPVRRDESCVISGDGRYVSFASRATNLVPETTYGAWDDAFVHDRQTGTTSLVSHTYDGLPGNWPSTPGVMSADGRYITFWSVATNILPGLAAHQAHWHVYDQMTGDITRVTVASDGTLANDNSYGSCISADGRYVTFGSHATNLVANDNNGELDLFLHDRDTGITTRISTALDGTAGNGKSSAHGQCISADGQYIVFHSAASNLIADDTNGWPDDFLYDQVTGEISRVSVASDGSQASGGRRLFDPSISLDGRFVEMEFWANNLVDDDTNIYTDVFLRDRLLGETSRVSVASWGEEANGDSFFGMISGNGRSVAFHSDATNLVLKDKNNASDVFVHDTLGLTNLIQNPGFETGTAPWHFWTSGEGSFAVEPPGYTGDFAGRVDIVESGDNVQLYQKGFTLEDKTDYHLEFAARANSGHDLAVYVHQHKDPYTNYGLRNFRVNVTEEWNTFVIDFRTKNISKVTDDSRLRLWLKPFDEAGDTYWFDSVSLVKSPTIMTSAAATAGELGTIAGRVEIAGDLPVYVVLHDMATEGETFLQMVRTDAAGLYQFTKIPYGYYTVAVQVPTGYLAPEAVQLAVGDLEHESIDFAVDAVNSHLYLPLINR